MIAQNNNLFFSTGLSVNVNKLEWSIAGNSQGQSPNTLSELIFRKITSAGPYLNISYKPFRLLAIKSLYQKSGVISGNGSDADYNGDNRTNNSYHETFSSDKGNVEKLYVGVCFLLIDKKKFSLGAGLLYASVIQKFYILNTGFENLESTYTANWKGAKISLSASYSIGEKLSLNSALLYWLYNYNARADWNLIYEFMHPLSFDQHSKGLGAEGVIQAKYKITSFLSLEASGAAGNAKSFKGVDRSYLRNYEQVVTQFNGSINHYYTFKIGTYVTLIFYG